MFSVISSAVEEWSGVGSRDIDGKAERLSERKANESISYFFRLSGSDNKQICDARFPKTRTRFPSGQCSPPVGVPARRVLGFARHYKRPAWNRSE